MHDQWEYKMLIGHGLRNFLQDENGVDYGMLTPNLLNKLGSEGWEVCSYTFGFSVPQPTLILKRRITPP